MDRVSPILRKYKELHKILKHVIPYEMYNAGEWLVIDFIPNVPSSIVNPRAVHIYFSEDVDIYSPVAKDQLNSESCFATLIYNIADPESFDDFICDIIAAAESGEGFVALLEC